MRAADGVMVAADDKNLKEHPEVKDVSNLAVLKLMESLTSRQLVRHQYAWAPHGPVGGRHHALREFLNLPDYCVPLTHKKQGRARRLAPWVVTTAAAASATVRVPVDRRPGGFAAAAAIAGATVPRTLRPSAASAPRLTRPYGLVARAPVRLSAAAHPRSNES